MRAAGALAGCIVFTVGVWSRDEDKIMKACYWPHEVYEPCFGGCAEVSCDNPSSHLRPCYPYCEPGCVCERPYVRDDRTHQCVLRADCTVTQMGIPVHPASKSHRKAARPAHWSPGLVVQTLGADDEDPSRPEPEGYAGNYFNIVIAPPPADEQQPRKTIQYERLRKHKRIV